MHYTLEFGGGLGDMFAQCYARGAYNVLRDLGPDDTAEVILVVHNQHAPELFEFHPKRAQLTIRYAGYWDCANDQAERAQRGLPPPGSNGALPTKTGPLEFYPSPSDRAHFDLLPERYLLLAAGAGTPDRCIPEPLLSQLLCDLRAQTGLPVVAVGRNYERDGRQEPVPAQVGGMIDLVDQLSVAGTAWLTQHCAGLITTHSALNLLGWYENRPQLLLYPQAVLDRHAKNGTYDQWLFGVQFPNTVPTLFTDYTADHMTRFLGVL